MKIFGLILLILGALCSFCAAFLVTKITKKEEAADKELLSTKLLGLLIAAIGLVLVFIS